MDECTNYKFRSTHGSQFGKISQGVNGMLWTCDMNQFVTIPAYGIPANYAFTDAKDAIIP
jgi:hypothetical protein